MSSSSLSPDASDSSSSPESSRSPLTQPVFRHLLLAQACFGVAFSIFLILPKYLATALHAGPARIGTIMAGAALTNVLAAPFIGRLTGRVRAHRAMVVGQIAMAIGALAFLMVGSAGIGAFAARAIQGLGWALVFTSAGLLAVDLAPRDRMAEAIALQGSASLITNAIGPALAEPVLDTHGPVPVFLAGAAMALLGAILTLRLRLPAQGPPALSPDLPVAALADAPVTAAALSAPVAPLAPVRRTAPAFVNLTALILGIACALMFTMHQPLALARGFDRVADFLIAYTFAAIGVRLIMGSFTRRHGPRLVAVGSFVLYGGIVAAMPLLGSRGLWAFGALFGVAHGLFFPSFLAVALGTAPDSARPTVIAWVNAAFNAGAVAVIPLGRLAEWGGFAAAFVPVGVLTVVSAYGLHRSTRVLARRAPAG